MAKHLIICFLAGILIISASCTKKPGEVSKTDSTTSKTTAGDKSQPTGNDTVFFAQWDGKKLIFEDNYKYAINEKSAETSGNNLPYEDKLKEIIKKYQKFDEQVSDYYFTDFKEEFEPYTSIRPGRTIYVSTAEGVYSVTISGYFMNFQDNIGGGVIFYATADAPKNVTFTDYAVMVCSYNENMSKSDTKGITNKSALDRFKEYVMPKLKGIKVTDYDINTQKEVTKKFEKLADENIKVIKGSFTGAGKDEYLVGVRFNNNPTTFTSAIWIMDEAGNVITEFSPLSIDNFIYAWPYLTIDFNGDGVWEIVTDDGYYEGAGYNFHRWQNGEFKLVTTGFVFGV